MTDLEQVLIDVAIACVLSLAGGWAWFAVVEANDRLNREIRRK